MKEPDKDLGLLTGLKTELLTLLAGVLSFTLLVEKAANEIEKFFSQEEQTAIYLFIILYFLIPCVLVITWLVFINARLGLKKWLMCDAGRKYRALVLSILVLFITLLLAFIPLGNQFYLSLCLLCFALILFYAIALCIRNSHNREDHWRRYRQARFQFILVFAVITVLWSANFIIKINKSNEEESDFKEWRLDSFASVKSQLPNAINASAGMRKQYRKFVESTEEIIQKYPGFPHVDTVFNEYLQADLARIRLFYLPSNPLTPDPSLTKRYSIMVRMNSLFESRYDALMKDIGTANTMIKDAEFKFKKVGVQKRKKKTHDYEQDSHIAELLSKQNQDKDDLERLQYSLIKFKQFVLLDSYQESMTTWLKIVQFKGLLVFNLVILFLLCIWYHAYLLNLEANEKDAFSEIDISRISIYVLFLLIIPFFKSIDKETIDFERPYISLSISRIFPASEAPTVRPVIPENQVDATPHLLDFMDMMNQKLSAMKSQDSIELKSLVDTLRNHNKIRKEISESTMKKLSAIENKQKRQKEKKYKKDLAY